MTEWNVYTVGSMQFIYSIFNAVAMLMNSGTFSDMFRIAALLGVIGVVIASAVSSGKTLSFQHMAVCIVMYLLFFQVSAHVNIEDVTTGKFRAVDNVPAGLAASASIISTVGYAITEKMEQAFSTPSMTEYGSLDPLFTLATLYDTMKSPMRWASNDPSRPYNNLDRSVSNYMRQCVGNDIIRGSKTYAALYRSNNGVAGLSSNDAFQRVVIYDSNRSGWDRSTGESEAGGSLYTCAEAYTKLKDLMMNTTSQLDSSFQRSYTALGRTCGGVPCNTISKMTEVMNFYNISGTDIRDFQLMMIMYPYFRDMPLYGYESSFRGTAAVTRVQTMTQQSFQWSSSGASFLSWMGSFMPIFQGMVYALTPFMAFLFGLGIMGLRMVLKYLLVVMWTQTWLPLAAIVNLYILVNTRETMSALFTTTGSISFSQLYNMLYETQKSIGLAGNLYAMIPALGGFIVWGSSIAFNSLAKSAAAPSAADTKTMAPDVTNTPAINSRGAEVEFNPAQGSVMGGTSGMLPTVDMKQVSSRNLSSAKQELDSSSSTLTTQSGAMLSHIASNMESGSKSQVYSDATNAALTRLSNADRSYVNDVAQKHGISNMQALVGMAKGEFSAGAGVSGGPGAFSASASAGMSRSKAESSGLSNTNTADYSNSTSSSFRDSDSATQARIVNTAANAAYNLLSERGETSAITQSYSEAQARMQSAQKSYQEAEQFSSSTSMGQTMNAAQIAQSIGHRAEAQSTLTQVLAAYPDLNQQIQEDTNRLTSIGMTEQDAHTFAQYKAAVDLGQAGDISRKAGFINSDSSPALTSIAAEANREVSRNATNAGHQAEAKASVIQSSASANAGSALGNIGSTKSMSSHEYGMGQVNDHNAVASGVVDSSRREFNEEVMTNVGNVAAQDLENNNYKLDGVAGGMNRVMEYGSNLFTKYPTYEQNYSAAVTAANEVPMDNSPDRIAAREAISQYYGAVKAGASGPTLDQARSNMMARVQLATGGSIESNGIVEGGNIQLAKGIAGRLEQISLDKGSNDSAIIQQAVTSLWTDRTSSNHNIGGKADRFDNMSVDAMPFNNKSLESNELPGKGSDQNDKGSPEVMIVTGTRNQ
ncbi:conjugal transfer protein TraG N-terminal domain-containing protein [Photorhabdus sp. APURE]|uniref:conjugal transfer protein TraG N-terminal domain-containing protein n=1 Tax=Photorhabdus aballayi TaxID=2991723 RepID=UPI00223CD37C|nr:conjugal transfer protein TraG N-terminal domain-containing protein [Photorhabdus aballayi]MCW7549975.1 conjugal transfer protein TraG N-terminal domain-containing protein [Photorhabdus aballayi]